MVGDYINTMKTAFDFNFDFYQAVKGSNRLCMMVELSSYVLWTNSLHSLQTYKMILRSIINEFGRKIDVQNRLFWWIRFKNRFLKIIK